VKEYEIYLPLNYNDGSRVPDGEIERVGEKLLEFFDGLTLFPQPNRGVWRMANVTFRDEIVIFRVLTAKPRSARMFLKKLKARLKKDFQQEEILIVEKDAEVI
jgi:hypothetical protein